MAVFSLREKKLIEYLAQRDSWISSSEIVSSLGISLRTLRNTVKCINSDHKYILSSNKGYKIIKNSKVIETLLHEMNQSEHMDREHIILKELMLNDGPVNYFELAAKLFISEQTLLSSITSLNKKLAGKGVMINRKKETLTLKGDEINLRQLFCDIVYNEVENSQFTMSALKDFFVHIDVAEIRQFIYERINYYQFKINDFVLNSIILHLCIIIDRREYEIVQEVQKKSVLDESGIPYQCSDDIMQWLEEKYHFRCNQYDFDVIYGLLLIGMKESNLNDGNKIDKIMDSSILELVKKIIADVYNEYYINLDDKEFIANFALHLNNIIVHQMALKNPLLSSIKDAYPVIYEISVFIAKQIQDKYPAILMDDHQISYLALHIGAQIEKQAMTKIRTIVINPEYLKLNSLILSKLETNFSNDLSIHMISDETELETMMLNHDDLILTTIPLKNYYGCKSVQVTVFINQSDIENIFEMISEIKHNRHFENETLLQYFDGSFCYFEHEEHYEEVIRKLCENHEHLDEEFMKRVMIREEMSPSEYMNIAVAHPIHCDEKDTFISVGVFKNRMKWQKNDVNIVFLLSVSQNDKKNFLKILRNLIEIFSSDQWMKYHSSIDTFDKFERFIQNYMIY